MYLNAGTGNPCAGHRTVMDWPIFAKAPNELKEELNVGFALPTGSTITRSRFCKAISLPQTDLNDGIGYAWAGHTSATGLPSYLAIPLILRSSENLGLALPMGSEMQSEVLGAQSISKLTWKLGLDRPVLDTPEQLDCLRIWQCLYCSDHQKILA